MNDAPTEVGPTQLSDKIDLAYSQEIPEQEPPSGKWGRAISIAAAIILLAGAIAGAVVFLGRNPDRKVDQAVAEEPADPHDRKFVQILRDDKIPVDDWRYTVTRAQSLCQALTTMKAAPGDDTIETARQSVKLDNAEWNPAQIYNYTATTIEMYCPQFWGPTPEELAAMAPDDRFLATIGSRVGISDPSVIRVGHSVCSQLEYGYAYDKVVGDIFDANNSKKNWTRDKAARLVDTSIEIYCPEGH